MLHQGCVLLMCTHTASVGQGEGLIRNSYTNTVCVEVQHGLMPEICA